MRELEITGSFETIEITAHKILRILEYLEGHRDLRITVSQTPGKNHQWELVWKTLKEKKKK